ncbi:unnamed protein product, partial [Rhizophagus irregularis]
MTDSDELTSSSRPPVFYSVSSYIVDPVIYRYSMGGATDNGANMIIDLQSHAGLLGSVSASSLLCSTDPGEKNGEVRLRQNYH